MPKIARSIEDVLLGEATHGTREERLADLMGIASVIHNRAALHGVTPEQIVSARGQFDAYGRAMPAGVEAYRNLAKEAWTSVKEVGPINSATYYATPRAVGALPNGLEAVTQTTGHRFFIDPLFRPIKTAVGVKPAIPSVAQDLLDGVEVAAEISEVPTPDFRPIDANIPVSAYAGLPENAGVSAIDGMLTGTVGQQDLDQTAAGSVNELGVVEREGYGSPLGALGDRITSGYGARDRPRTSLGLGSAFHQGTDLSLGPGAENYPAEATAGGIVSNVYRSPSLGNTVEVTHPDGFVSRYSHLNEIGNVQVGEEIARGTPVGMVGNTGNSAAAHLHFSMVDPEGNLVDPASKVGFSAENSLPTPQFAERQQPGDMISSLMNEAVQPSLGDPNEALAASFNMDRFGDPVGQQVADFDMGRFADPVQEQAASFDAARFGDPNAALAESFDMARMGVPAGQVAQSREALADTLAASNKQAAFQSQQMADIQARANEARRALEDQAARAAQATQSASLGSPVGVDGQVTASTGVSAAADAAGITPRSMSDLAGQYAAYGAGKISPSQNLAADVLDQDLSRKQARTPSYAVAQQTVDPNAGTTQGLDVSTFSEPEAIGDEGVAATSIAQPSNAKQAVETGAETELAKAEDPNKGRLARSFANRKTVGSALGATLGGLIGGPFGALALGTLGAKIGDLKAAERPRETPLQALFNIMTGKPQSRFPTTPPGGEGTGRGVGYGDLNDFGRGQYNESGDFRDAIDKGGVGLY